jgi:hypothetical protein
VQAMALMVIILTFLKRWDGKAYVLMPIPVTILLYLYDSIKKLFSLDDYVAVLPSHFGRSQCGAGLSSVPLSTIGYEKRFNRSVDALLDKQKFIDYMKNQKTMEIPDHFKIKNINKGNNLFNIT